jgi:hypothetical protein
MPPLSPLAHNAPQKAFCFFGDPAAVRGDPENDYQTARKYWKVLKGRILAETGQPVTICYQFKLRAADGKMRLTDVADQHALARRTGVYAHNQSNSSRYEDKTLILPFDPLSD